MNLRYGFGWRHAAVSFARRSYVRSKTTHLQGPKRFKLADNEVALILLGRDVMHSAAFIVDYYRTRGVSKFVYLDNGSKDGSEHFFASEPNVIVAQSLVNFRDYEAELRFIATSDYAQGGWRLAVDADELLDYPCSASLDIADLVNSMENEGFTGLVAQMLEMVPRGSLRAYESETFAECVKAFTSYSTDAIVANDYHASTEPLHYFASKNQISNSAIKIMRGGLRRTVFGEDCMLTKHVLFKDGRNVLPFPHPHFTCGLSIADFTAVLYHYKFAGRYLERERMLDSEGRLAHGEGKARLRAFAKNDDISFDFAGLQSNPSANDLLQQGFLVGPHVS